MPGCRLNRSTSLDYLRFFCGLVHGEEGAFTIYEDRSTLAPTPAFDEKVSRRAAALAAKCRIVVRKRGAKATSENVDAMVKYSHGIFQARFRVHLRSSTDAGSTVSPGNIEMLDDRPRGLNLPVYADVFRNGLRTRIPLVPKGKPELRPGRWSSRKS